MKITKMYYSRAGTAISERGILFWTEIFLASPAGPEYFWMPKRILNRKRLLNRKKNFEPKWAKMTKNNHFRAEKAISERKFFFLNGNLFCESGRAGIFLNAKGYFEPENVLNENEGESYGLGPPLISHGEGGSRNLKSTIEGGGQIRPDVGSYYRFGRYCRFGLRLKALRLKGLKALSLKRLKP